MPTVLIIDDEPSLCELVSGWLTSNFHVSCIEASDATAALTRLGSARVDVVFLDLDLAVMDGIQILESLRRSKALRALPVVLMTDRPEETRIKAALGLGLAAVLLKPFSEAALCARVRPILGSYGKSSGAERRQATPLALRDHQTVLIVESDAVRRDLLVATLGRAARIRAAENEFVATSTFSSSAPDIVWLGETSGVWSRAQLLRAMRESPARGAVNFVASLPKEDLVDAAASGQYAAVIRRTADLAELETELVRVLDPVAAAHVLLRPEAPLVSDIFSSLADVGLAITPAADGVPAAAGRHAVASAVLSAAGAHVALTLSVVAAAATELLGSDVPPNGVEAGQDRPLTLIKAATAAWARLAATSVAMRGLGVEVEQVSAQWANEPPPPVNRRLHSGRAFETARGRAVSATIVLRSPLPIVG